MATMVAPTPAGELITNALFNPMKEDHQNEDLTPLGLNRLINLFEIIMSLWLFTVKSQVHKRFTVTVKIMESHWLNAYNRNSKTSLYARNPGTFINAAPNLIS